MLFQETRIAGAFLIEPERHQDERGFFARLWTPEEFHARGLNPAVDHCDLAFNLTAGTIRGMHFQVPPHAETKIVRCTQGAIFDVVVDLRPDSPTFRGWFGANLDAENRLMLYVPAGLAHGYYTLADRSEVAYQIGGRWMPDAARGVRWNDPAFGIAWPGPVRVITSRDASYPDFLP